MHYTINHLPSAAGSARTSVKKQSKKETRRKWVRRTKEKVTEAEKAKPPTPTWAAQALIGEEEQIGKKKEK